MKQNTKPRNKLCVCVYGNFVDIKVAFQITEERVKCLINGVYAVVNYMKKIIRPISHHIPNLFLGGL